MRTITFKHAKYATGTAQVHFGQYGQGRTAIRFMDPEEGPVGVPTVNMPEVDVPDGHVLIKNYSENEGYLEDLIEQGFISAPERTVKAGFSDVYLCKLLVDPDEGKVSVPDFLKAIEAKTGNTWADLGREEEDAYGWVDGFTSVDEAVTAYIEKYDLTPVG